MRKLTYFKSLLFVALLGATLGACHSDELATREVREPEAVEVKADSFSLKLDFPSIAFRSKVTAVSEEGSENSENSEKATRTSLLVKNDGTTQLELNTGEATTMTVLLILRNQDGSKVYVSANNNWNIVKGQELSLDASGIYNFTAVKGPSGAPTMTKDDVWFLDAMTGGDWDATNKAYIINKKCQIPNKLYKPGEKLVLGRDITVPFQLGTDAVGRVGERRWGVRMAVANNDRNSSNLTPRLVCIDTDPNFLPYGSLLCMRFKNSMHKLSEDPGIKKHLDNTYNQLTWKKTSFSYFLRGISVESSTSTAGGWIDVRSLAAPDRAPLSWHGFRPDGHGYSFTNVHDDPFFQEVRLDKADPNNLKTGYPLFRLKDGQKDTDWTPYYYVWMKSIDESRDNALYGSEGLHVRMQLFNATLEQSGLGSRTAFVSEKNHKSGRAYFREKELVGGLVLTPLGYFGPDFVLSDSRYGGAYVWPDSVAENRVLANSRYFLPELRGYFANTFDVNGRPSVSGAPTLTGLKWQIPDAHTVNSVFPPHLGNINASSHARGDDMQERTEDVKIGGVLYKGMKSYYYREANFVDNESNSPKNYNSYYALRFVGTPFCEAVRYTEYGKWYHGTTGNPGNKPGDYTPDSRFVIHTRHLGNEGVRFKDDASAKAFLKNVVAANRPRMDQAPHNEFWGNFWKPDVSRGITLRVFHVPGSPTPAYGYGAPQESARVGAYVGMVFQMAVKNGYWKGTPNFMTYQFDNAGRFQHSFDFNDPFKQLFKEKYQATSVLPVLAPAELEDPAYVDAARQ